MDTTETKESKSFVILGEPISLKRARYGQGRVYDSQKEIKEAWQWELKAQSSDPFLLDIPLSLDITFYMKISKSRKDILCGDPHFYRPDLSNLIKFVEDVCTGIIYVDDCLIMSCYATKIYDCSPRTEFTLIPWRKK